MTVEAVARRVQYTGNGLSTGYAVPFQFFELEVYIDEELQTIGTDYTITQISPGTFGTVTFHDRAYFRY
jgi:hypothetical protein